ncbi:MAG: hypothetical protein AAFQ66_21910 [Pseudomonadota bacterium]
MSDFQLRTPELSFRQPNRLSLGDYQLRLDPTLQAEIEALRSGPPSPQLRQLILRPNWRNYAATQPDPRLTAPPTPARPPLVPQGAGPDTPRPGEVSDVLRAVWAIPSVQSLANRTLDEAGRRVRHNWSRLGTGGQILFVSHTGIMAAGALAGVLSNTRTRQAAYQLILNRDIPVPGVDGLRFRILERGGQVNYSNIAGSGVSARVRGEASATGQPQGEVMITIDLTRWVRALR